MHTAREIGILFLVLEAIQIICSEVTAENDFGIFASLIFDLSVGNVTLTTLPPQRAAHISFT